MGGQDLLPPAKAGGARRSNRSTLKVTALISTVIIVLILCATQRTQPPPTPPPLVVHSAAAELSCVSGPEQPLGDGSAAAGWSAGRAASAPSSLLQYNRPTADPGGSPRHGAEAEGGGRRAQEQWANHAVGGRGGRRGAGRGGAGRTDERAAALRPASALSSA